MRDKTPYFTVARFDSTCAETGKPIRKGERIAYYPATRKAYSESSKQAGELRELEFNQSFCMADANW